jgi:hypothetical protein
LARVAVANAAVAGARPERGGVDIAGGSPALAGMAQRGVAGLGVVMG